MLDGIVTKDEEKETPTEERPSTRNVYSARVCFACGGRGCGKCPEPIEEDLDDE